MIFDCLKCGHTFELNSAKTERIEGNLITKECPNCGQIHAFPDHEDELELIEYKPSPGEDMIDIFREIAFLQEQLDTLDDESLVDEVSEFLAIFDFMLGTDKIFFDFNKTGILTPDERKKLEGVYILCNSDPMIAAQDAKGH